MSDWIPWDGTPPEMGEGLYWVKVAGEVDDWPMMWSAGVSMWSYADQLCAPHGVVTHYHPARLEPPQ